MVRQIKRIQKDTGSLSDSVTTRIARNVSKDQPHYDLNEANIFVFGSTTFKIAATKFKYSRRSEFSSNLSLVHFSFPNS